MIMNGNGKQKPPEQGQGLYPPFKTCLSVLVGALAGALLTILSIPLFIWWFQNGFRPDEIPDNKIGVIFCAFLFGGLSILGGAIVGLVIRQRK
jgi:hypothetical protein